MPRAVTLRLLPVFCQAATIGVVFGGLWLGRYMVADRPLPTIQAAAPPAAVVSGAQLAAHCVQSIPVRS